MKEKLSAQHTITPHRSLTEIADQYDAFLLDLWGVIHDGAELYPDVIPALEMLRNKDKKIIMLSNAPRRVERAAEKLDQLGVGRELYDHVMTSGEAVFHWIKDAKPFPEGQKFLMLGPSRDDGLLDGLNYAITRDPDEASFIIVTGYDEDDSPEDEKKAELEAGFARNLPLICANPDHVIVRRSGKRALCAGVIADQYTAMGGSVTQFGKPFRQVYEECFDLFKALGVYDTGRIIAIGDNLDTDIKGASDVGINSVLIAGGILGEELGCHHGELPDQDKLHHICREKHIYPNAVLPAFVWC